MSVRSSQKSRNLRAVNAALFIAGMEYMRCCASLNSARGTILVEIKRIHMKSARESHRQYLKYLKMSSVIRHAPDVRTV